MKNLKNITAIKGSIRAQILKDACGEISYIKDAAERGCVGGNCNNLVYYSDTHKFYNKHAEEIDELLEEMEEQTGEPYNITENMKRLGQSNLRNFLAWLAYEVKAQEIMQELEDENDYRICTFNACKNKQYTDKSGFEHDICKKHFLQGINN